MVPHIGFEGPPCGRAHPLLEPSRSGASERLLGGHRPHEAGELSRAGDDDLLGRLAAAGHPAPARVQPLLAASGALDRNGILAALATGELIADGRPPARVPGGLDEQPAHVRVADLGDRALSALLPGGVLRRHEPNEGHELFPASEAAEVPRRPRARPALLQRRLRRHTPLDDDYMTLSTVHSAKGLEWDIVHLIGASDGNFPSDMALTTPEGLEEERRLFYVALTRARHTLVIYVPQRYYHRPSARDDAHGYGKQSRFLAPKRSASASIQPATNNSGTWTRLRIEKPWKSISPASEIARRRIAHGSGLGRARWVVERTFAWLHNHKRLLVRYDRRHEIHEAFLALACCLVCFRRLQPSF
jgi:transposase